MSKNVYMRVLVIVLYTRLKGTHSPSWYWHLRVFVNICSCHSSTSLSSSAQYSLQRIQFVLQPNKSNWCCIWHANWLRQVYTAPICLGDKHQKEKEWYFLLFKHWKRKDRIKLSICLFFYWNSLEYLIELFSYIRSLCSFIGYQTGWSWTENSWAGVRLTWQSHFADGSTLIRFKLGAKMAKSEMRWPSTVCCILWDCCRSESDQPVSIIPGLTPTGNNIPTWEKEKKAIKHDRVQ